METTKKEIKFTEALRLVKELGQPYITACQVVHKNYNVLKMRNLNGHGSQYYKTPHSLWCSVDRTLEKKRHRERLNKRNSRAKLRQKQSNEIVAPIAPKTISQIKLTNQIKTIMAMNSLSEETKITILKEILK